MANEECKCEEICKKLASPDRMTLRQTRTTVHLDLPVEMHAYIKQRLLDAGYHHAIDGHEVDMHGITVVPQV